MALLRRSLKIFPVVPGVVEEEYVRRNVSADGVDDVICNPELVHAAREHMESALGFEEPRQPSR